LATGLPSIPPRYHQSQLTKTAETPTHTRDQTPASFMETLCAPCFSMAKKSTTSATRTKAANSDHIRGVPMDIIDLALP